MSFREITKNIKTYNSARTGEDLVNDFYNPVLSHAQNMIESLDILLQQVWQSQQKEFLNLLKIKDI